MSGADVVIFGAGHAGAHAAIALRTNGFTGTTTMIGRESEPPCERPPLSKETFAREKTFDRLYIRQPQFRGRKHVELKLSAEVTVVDPSDKALTLSDGSTYTYGKLIWATCVAKSIRGALVEAETAE